MSVNIDLNNNKFYNNSVGSTHGVTNNVQSPLQVNSNGSLLDLTPVIVLSITQFERDPDLKIENSGDPVLFYVYLGERIQDVRGISRDETRIRVISPVRQDENATSYKSLVFEKSILIQVKQGSNNTLGYLRIPLSVLSTLTNHNIKTWFPLFPDKEHEQLSLDFLQNGAYQSKAKVYIDLKVIEELPQKTPMYNSPSKNPFKTATSPNQQTATQSPININNPHGNNFYRDDISTGTYEEISENITLIQGRPQQDPIRYTAQSNGQQIFKKKKKTYTQSALPQIQLVPSSNNNSQSKLSYTQYPSQQSQLPLTPAEISKQLIKEEWLQQLPTNIDKVQVKHDLIQFVDLSVLSIQETSQQHSKDLSSWYTQTKQIAQTDAKDLIVNDQRQTQISALQKDTMALTSYRKEQDNVKQQLETQSKLIEMHGQHQSKREKLERLQEVVQRLKTEMLNLQNQTLQENSPKKNGESTVADKIQLLKQELLMHVAQIKQTVNIKTLQDQVYQEADSSKSQFLNTQIQQTSELERIASDQLTTNQDQLKIDQELATLKHQHLYTQHTIEHQNLEINFLQKQILAEQQQIKHSEITYRDLLKRQHVQLLDDQQKLEQLNSKIEDMVKQKQLLTADLSLANETLENMLTDRINDPQCLQSSPQVREQTSEIEDSLLLLKYALNERQEVVEGMKNLNAQLNIQVNGESLHKILSVNQASDSEIVKEKNDLLETKEKKNYEVLHSIDQINAQIDIANSKVDIHSDFKQQLSQVEDKERALAIEQQRLKKVYEDFKRWREESTEKLHIQDKDFKTFEEEMLHQDEELKKLKLIEQNKLDSLLGIKTKDELENYMRERLSIIREMEASLRGRDHEIDTLELIQSQKDSIILDLEEQAGKFKEVVKEVHYESQKNDRVEAALGLYLDVYPSKIDMRKLGDGYYKFGTRRIYVKLDADQQTLLVRVAPKEYITLAMFIIENEGIELQKMGVGKALANRFKQQ